MADENKKPVTARFDISDIEKLKEIAEKKGFQTVSFDLPQHGERSCDESPEEKIWVFNVFNALTDLRQMAEYVYARWKAVSLFGNSYGAQISLRPTPAA